MCIGRVLAHILCSIIGGDTKTLMKRHEDKKCCQPKCDDGFACIEDNTTCVPVNGTCIIMLFISYLHATVE